jgi:glycosidase
MQVILDGVFNHASSDSTYFNEYDRFSTLGACQSLSSPYRTWFHFNDDNVPCTPADYPGWDGDSTLPTFDHTQTAVQNFFYSSTGNVMQNWYSQGAGGWRFDVADDPNFPYSWWIDTRQYAKGYNPNGPLIGEIWPNASQWLAGNGLDSVMNYRFRRNVSGFVRWPYNFVDNNDNGNDAIIPLAPSQFDTANRAIRDDYPPQSTAVAMNLIDSHDTNRALYVFTELGDNGLVQAKQRLELAATFQFTYIGTPTVFYGDEAGINAPSEYSGSNGPVGDPYGRAPYPWTDQPGDPTIYGPPDQNVISYYTLLGHLRKQHPSLRDGSFVTLLTGDTQQASSAPNTYAFARQDSQETAIVALNNGSSTNSPSIPVGAYYPDGTQLQDAISGATYTVSGGNLAITLNATTGMVFFPSPNTVDLTPPTGSISPSPSLNGAGWVNSSPITANISSSDTGSGVSQIRFWVDSGAVFSVSGATGSTSVSGEGQHTVGLRVIDNAGNISALITQAVNIDLTAPVVTVTGVTQGGDYAQGSAAPGCNTTDALSGVATAATLSVTGGNGNGQGNFTATCSGGTDLAGNTAAPVSVGYTISPAALAASSGAHTDGANGTRNVVFSLKDTGFGTTTNATITSISSISVVSGSGSVTVASGVPADLGTLAPGASAQTTVTFNWPVSASRVSMRVNFSADGGYSGSTVITMFR